MRLWLILAWAFCVGSAPTNAGKPLEETEWAMSNGVHIIWDKAKGCICDSPTHSLADLGPTERIMEITLNENRDTMLIRVDFERTFPANPHMHGYDPSRLIWISLPSRKRVSRILSEKTPDPAPHAKNSFVHSDKVLSEKNAFISQVHKLSNDGQRALLSYKAEGAGRIYETFWAIVDLGSSTILSDGIGDPTPQAEKDLETRR